MLRLLIWLLLGYCVYLLFRGRKTGNISPTEKAKPVEDTHRDPVCGVYVSSEDAVVGNLEGERLYFCSMGCLEKFRDQLEHKA